MDERSGLGKESVIPPEIKRWNWGAFGLNWIWSVSHGVYIGLLVFVPFVNLVMPFVLGAKGNTWAWQNKRWESVAQFQATQRKWAIATAGTVAAVLVFIPLLVAGVNASLKSSEVYGFAEQTLQQDPRIVAAIGVPFETGTVSGSYSVTGPTGSASLAIPLEGPRGKGTAYIEAARAVGTWTVQRFEVEVDGAQSRIQLRDGR